MIRRIRKCIKRLLRPPRSLQFVRWLNKIPPNPSEEEMLATIAVMLRDTGHDDNTPDLFLHILRVWARERNRTPEIMLVVKSNGDMAWTSNFDSEMMEFHEPSPKTVH